MRFIIRNLRLLVLLLLFSSCISLVKSCFYERVPFWFLAATAMACSLLQAPDAPPLLLIITSLLGRSPIHQYLQIQPPRTEPIKGSVGNVIGTICSLINLSLWYLKTAHTHRLNSYNLTPTGDHKQRIRRLDAPCKSCICIIYCKINESS